jgi:hypothetical protein
VGDDLVGDGFAAGTQLVDGASEIDGIPGLPSLSVLMLSPEPAKRH